MNAADAGSDAGSPHINDSEPWPPSFPHAAIDALLEKLEKDADAESTDAEELLQLIGREAQRLRTAVVRLSSAQLSEAESEAHRIRTDAEKQAHAVRKMALAELNSRIAEAEELAAATQRSRPTKHRSPISGMSSSDVGPSEGPAPNDCDR